MRELAAMLKCDFLARAAALEDGRVQVGQRGQEVSLGKEGRKEGRKKGRKKEINCTPTFSSSFVPTWVLLIISRSFQLMISSVASLGLDGRGSA